MKRVHIAELRVRLSEYLRYVREGHEVTVMDRDSPVARIAPVDAAAVLPARQPVAGSILPGQISFPPPLVPEVDPLGALLLERQGGR
jgi:prevent-host-death family protein